MDTHFDADRVRRFYDEYGEREWLRLEATAHDRLIHHLHRRFLAPYLGKDRTVLDAGCGAGRFSMDLARDGSNVTLFDLSEGQLAIARGKLDGAGLGGRIAGFHIGDVRDLGLFPDAVFDTVVCYGGVLNYVFEDAPRAVAELVRVTRPGGAVVVSVTHRWGVLRFAVANERLDPGDFFGRPAYWHIPLVAASGDLPEHPEVPHPARHFFTAAEIRDLLTTAGLVDVRLAAAPALSTVQYARLEAIAAVPEAWATLLALEEQAFEQPDLVGAGEFLLAAGRLREDPISSGLR